MHLRAAKSLRQTGQQPIYHARAGQTENLQSIARSILLAGQDPMHATSDAILWACTHGNVMVHQIFICTRNMALTNAYSQHAQPGVSALVHLLERDQWTRVSTETYIYILCA